MISAVIMMYWTELGGSPDSSYRYLADPLSSLVIVGLIARSAIPLYRECYRLLLLSVPEDTDFTEIQTDILAISGVRGIHDLHIWTLHGEKKVLSAHIQCEAERNFMEISDEIKRELHKKDIHSSTLQPEYCDLACEHIGDGETDCHDHLCGDEQCQEKSCCRAGS